MAVVDNAVPKNSQNPDDNNNANKDNDLYDSSKPSKDGVAVVVNSKDSNFDHHHSQSNGDHSVDGSFDHHSNGFDVNRQHHVVGGGESNGRGTTATGANQIQIQNQRTTPTGNGHGLDDMSDLAEILSNLNPMAKEFVPPSLSNNNNGHHAATAAAAAAAFLANGFPANYVPLADHGAPNGFPSRKKKNNFGQGRRRMNTRTSMAQREEIIRKTVYVSDIDQQVTEEQLASLFIHCGQVVDCRICGDPNSILRFAFVEFTDEDSARAALNLSGTMLGFYPLRVLPSKTAIAPVNPTFLPRSEDEREMCARTVYCTNIDKKIPQAELRLFFESFCGEVHRLRLLGDYHHSTRIAFVEFVMAESAIAALNCSGAVLGTLPIRVSPSKTPVRPRIPRSPMH